MTFECQDAPERTQADLPANDNSAPEATGALSVEQFKTTAKQIGTLVTSVRETTDARQLNLGQTEPAARPTVGQLAESCAAAVAAGVPSIAAELGHDGLTALMADVLRQVTSTPRPADCPDWCVTNHTVDTDPGWHQGPAIGVTLSVPGLNSVPGEPLETLLSASVVQHNDEPDAFGIETRIWLDTGLDTTEMNIAQTDELITGLEALIPKLRTMRNHLVAASAEDRPGNPVVLAARMAEVDARVKAINEAEGVHA